MNCLILLFIKDQIVNSLKRLAAKENTANNTKHDLIIEIVL